MKGRPIILLVAGCAADGPRACPQQQPQGCDSWAACNAGLCVDLPLYVCDESTGEWVDSGTICEGYVVSFYGRAPLAQSVAAESGACPPIVPRAPLVLDGLDDGTLTVAAPAVLVSGEISTDFEAAGVHAVVDDDWYGHAVEVDYQLSVDYRADGVATTTVDTCQLMLSIWGPVCPAAVEPCDTSDAGWTLQCQAGIVRADDLTTYSYCAHGATTPACTSFGARGSIVLTCPAACADETVHAFATTADFLAFDPASLCAP